MAVPPPGKRDAGQAAVEAALTLPLVVFLMLGTLELFLMLQARLLAQYATERAARAGSLNFGNCAAMNEAAIATLLPSINSFLTPGGSASRKYEQAFRLRRGNRFVPGKDSGHDRAIVWIDRTFQNVPADPEEDFDLPYSAAVRPSREPIILETHLTFWYPLRIPFADWVMSRMALAHWGLQAYSEVNPLMETQTASWVQDGSFSPNASVSAELLIRNARKQYVFPIDTAAVTRMMTPPRDFSRTCW